MHVVQLHHALHTLNTRVPVYVVSFADLPYYRAWLNGALFEHAPRNIFDNTHFLMDPYLRVYHAYGLGRNSFLRVYGPRILWHYVKLYARGQQLPKMRQDTLQSGGDFVIGHDGRLRLAYVGKDQSDRPKLVTMLEALHVKPSP